MAVLLGWPCGGAPMFSCTSSAAPASAGCLCHRPEIHALNRRLGADLSRRGLVAGAAASMVFPMLAAAQAPPNRVVFVNLRLFDGKSDSLHDGLRVLVEDKRIKAVAQGNPAGPDGARVIDCGG